MNSVRTGVILGAGASACYEDGRGPLPLQRIKDMAEAGRKEAERLENHPLLQAILDLQGIAFDLATENAELRRERDERANMTFRDRVYWNDANPQDPGSQPSQASDDLAGGLTFSAGGGIDTSRLGIPADLTEWNRLF